MSARSGLVGKNPPGPIWGHLGPFFPWAGKIKKMQKFCLFSLVGQWALFKRFAPKDVKLQTKATNSEAVMQCLIVLIACLSQAGPSRKFGTQTDPKNKIRVAQNVGKVWISWKKNLPAPFGAPGPFFAWAGRIGKY